MTGYLLSMEGVNQVNFIEDTDDLNTMRGAGLLLLQAPERVARKFPTLSSILTGASVGLFSFEAANDDAAKDMRCRVAEYLQADPDLGLATFVVDVQPSISDTFMADWQKVLARNRWRQFQQPTVVLPAINQNPLVKVCPVDKLRPGTEPARTIKDKRVSPSSSVARRRHFGMDQKQYFYQDEIRQHLDLDFEGDFVHEFDELTADPEQGALHNKMAVIYLDGNRFTKIREEKCRDASDLEAFDRHLKSLRALALDGLLKRLGRWPAGVTTGGLYRLETLRWGGDELTWVVPAWLGWMVLGSFYQDSRNWVFKGSRLTHGGGLVFCHHHAPIHRIVDLAHVLAEEAKKADPPRNLFQYLVLESFDHAGQDLEEYHRKRFPPGGQISLDGEEMIRLAGSVAALKAILPRRAIQAAIRAALKESAPDRDSAYDLFTQRLQELNPGPTMTQLGQLYPILGEKAAWIHLADLWDYIPDDLQDFPEIDLPTHQLEATP